MVEERREQTIIDEHFRRLKLQILEDIEAGRVPIHTDGVPGFVWEEMEEPILYMLASARIMQSTRRN